MKTWIIQCISHFHTLARVPTDWQEQDVKAYFSTLHPECEREIMYASDDTDHGGQGVKESETALIPPDVPDGVDPQEWLAFEMEADQL